MTNIYSSVDDVKEMADRRQECQLALVEALSRRSRHQSTSLNFWREFGSFKIICIPRLETLEQVYYVNDYADSLKTVLDCVDITLFKIPRLVNNVEGYVEMLLREHYERL